MDETLDRSNVARKREDESGGKPYDFLAEIHRLVICTLDRVRPA